MSLFAMERPNPTMLFDRKLLALRRDRAAKGLRAVSFLKDRAVNDVCERLDFINRRFEQGLDIGSHGGFLAAAIARHSTVSAKVGVLALHLLLRGVLTVLDRGVSPICLLGSLQLTTELLACLLECILGGLKLRKRLNLSCFLPYAHP